KYNRPCGTVTIVTSHISKDRFRIGVTDTGFGIPRAKLGLLFQPFERLGAEQSEAEGTGLGLEMSKRLAEAMGGTLLVETTVDVGSTFFVELAPTERPPGAATPSSDVKPSTGGRTEAATGTVLYIEDNGSNVKLMERVLQRRPGVTLIAAADGAT